MKPVRFLILALLVTPNLLAQSPQYTVHTDATLSYEGNSKEHFIELDEVVKTHGYYCRLSSIDSDSHIQGVKLTCLKAAGYKDSDSEFLIMAACNDTRLGDKDNAYLRFRAKGKPTAHFHLSCETRVD